jgi:hypothetical protein
MKLKWILLIALIVLAALFFLPYLILALFY